MNFQECPCCFNKYRLHPVVLNWGAFKQFIFTGVVVLSSDLITWDIFLLHSYFKQDYTPSPLVLPPGGTVFPSTEEKQLPQHSSCLHPSPLYYFEVFSTDSRLLKVCRTYPAASSALLFSSSLWSHPPAQKPQCLRADTVFVLVTDLTPETKNFCKMPPTACTAWALTFTSQGPRRVYIPVRSQPLEQCKRPAKDSQVKPDAVGWKDTEW